MKDHAISLPTKDTVKKRKSSSKYKIIRESVVDWVGVNFKDHNAH